jgi:hypothetical protein
MEVGHEAVIVAVAARLVLADTVAEVAARVVMAGEAMVDHQVVVMVVMDQGRWRQE